MVLSIGTYRGHANGWKMQKNGSLVIEVATSDCANNQINEFCSHVTVVDNVFLGGKSSNN